MFLTLKNGEYKSPFRRTFIRAAMVHHYSLWGITGFIWSVKGMQNDSLKRDLKPSFSLHFRALDVPVVHFAFTLICSVNICMHAFHFFFLHIFTHDSDCCLMMNVG